MASAQAFTAHLLARLDADLVFLRDQHLLSQPDLELIRSKLAPAGLDLALQGLHVDAHKTAPPPAAPLAASVAGGVGAGAGKPKCRAVWDYVASQPDDLGFSAGDIITIEDEVNTDWWKGSINGRTGLFPCNHVERIPPTSAPPPPAPASGPAYSPSYSQPPPNQWTPPPPPSAAGPPSYAYQQPQFYGSGPPPPAFGEKASYAPPPPPPQHQPPAPQQIVVQHQQPPTPTEEEKKKGRLGRFGKQMGGHVAQGAGFGLGAGLASEAVHAVFR
ncbi:SH3 domain-containing protein [Rhodotorula paludigena]|uniref:SH3 domain-containing protein n=1 Tax=Rhodotorula paludigena TaxID=86838 RepID=UPI00316AFFD6